MCNKKNFTKVRNEVMEDWNGMFVFIDGVRIPFDEVVIFTKGTGRHFDTHAKFARFLISEHDPKKHVVLNLMDWNEAWFSYERKERFVFDKEEIVVWKKSELTPKQARTAFEASEKIPEGKTAKEVVDEIEKQAWAWRGDALEHEAIDTFDRFTGGMKISSGLADYAEKLRSLIGEGVDEVKADEKFLAENKLFK